MILSGYLFLRIKTKIELKTPYKWLRPFKISMTVMSLCIYTQNTYTHIDVIFKRLSLFKIELAVSLQIVFGVKNQRPLLLYGLWSLSVLNLFESTVKTPLSVTASVIDVDGRAFLILTPC